MVVPKRFGRTPILPRLWNHTGIIQRHRFNAANWSFAVHLLLFAILAMVQLSQKDRTPVSLVMSFSSTSDLAELESIELGSLGEFELPIEAAGESAPAAVQPVDMKVELQDLDVEPVADDALSLPANLTSAVPDSTAATNDTSASESQSTAEGAAIADVDRRVGNAGGRLEAPLRISLAFDGDSDLDLHAVYTAAPIRGERGSGGQFHVCFATRQTPYAILDVDANAREIMHEPCENIVFHTIPKKGKLSVGVHCFRARTLEIIPYTIVIKYGNTTHVAKGGFGGYVLGSPMKEVGVFTFNNGEISIVKK